MTVVGVWTTVCIRMSVLGCGQQYVWIYSSMCMSMTVCIHMAALGLRTTAHTYMTTVRIRMTVLGVRTTVRIRLTLAGVDNGMYTHTVCIHMTVSGVRTTVCIRIKRVFFWAMVLDYRPATITSPWNCVRRRQRRLWSSP